MKPNEGGGGGGRYYKRESVKSASIYLPGLNARPEVLLLLLWRQRRQKQQQPQPPHANKQILAE